MTAYPLSFRDISTWATDNNVPMSEARVRFAQYGVLASIAQSRTLRNVLVFKGGNALDFVWQPNRSTTDLDFSVSGAAGTTLDAAALKTLLDGALSAAGREMNITFAVHRVRQQPPGPGRTFITYEARIGYALQDQSELMTRMNLGQPSTQALSVDISINEVVCSAVDVTIDSTRSLRICTIEDIIAEKLRALLQQSSRNRTRPQDLLDIAVCLRTHGRTDLSRQQIGHYLIEKSQARGITASREAFTNPDLRSRAHQNYAALAATTRVEFVPFDKAMDLLLGLVETLDLP